MYFVYIMANRKNGTIYIGVTNDLARRVSEHKQGLVSAFTKRYGLKMLVYYEAFQYVEESIAREHAMKAWKREWKIKCINAFNSTWADLSLNLNN